MGEKILYAFSIIFNPFNIPKKSDQIDRIQNIARDVKLSQGPFELISAHVLK